jgi:rubrerythrin
MVGQMTFTRIAMSCALALLCCTGFAAAESKEPAKNKTLDNLQTAFDGESNANARYKAFAKKADEEGYAKVAVLFRAAARAEEVHATNYAGIIKKMGGAPKTEAKAPDVKATKENLEAAIKGETGEAETMYADFLKQARDDGNKDAVRAFSGAKAVEADHAKLYKEAVGNLDGWKVAADFYVCPVCGYTAPKLPDKKCPVCSTPKEKFETIK